MKKFLPLALLSLITLTVPAGELFQFDQFSWNLFDANKIGNLVSVEKAPLEGTERQLSTIHWSSPHPNAIILISKTPKIIQDFDQDELILTVHASQVIPIKRMILRLKDASGKIFQLTQSKYEALHPGKNEIHYTLDTTDPLKSAKIVWKGQSNNENLEKPLLLYSIGVDLDAKTPDNQLIRFDSLEILPRGELATISLNTGNRFNLLLPVQNTEPKLIIDNIGTKPLELSGIITIEDSGTNRNTENTSVVIPVGQKGSLQLPGDYSKPGWWKVNYSLKTTSGKEFSGTHRLGRMNPAGPTPGRAEEFLFGLCGHPFGSFRKSPESFEMEAQVAGLCGAKILRTDFTWALIQPQRDEWNFSFYDRLLDTYEHNGVEMQVLLDYSVAWAVPADRKPKNPEFSNRNNWLPEPNAFSKYCQEVAKRYKDRVKYFEIWNEPDMVHFANFPPESYLELLQIGYNAVKQVAPDAKVISGGISNIGSNRSSNSAVCNAGILDLIYADGGKHYDIFAFHGYGPIAKYADSIRQLQDEYKLVGTKAPRPWYSNETAESSAIVGEQKQATILFQKFLYAWSEGAIGYNWYLLREKSQYPIGHMERHYGLVTAEFEPKPAYITYNMLANVYKGGKFLHKIEFSPDIFAGLFENRNHDGLLALWGSDGDKSFWLSGVPAGTTIIDLYGNETPLPVRDGLAQVQISNLPFTLRIPEIGKHPIQCAGKVLSKDLPSRLVVPAGGSNELELSVNNPLDVTMTMEVRIEGSKLLTADPSSRTITLPANGNETIKIKLTADPQLKASSASPEMLKLFIAPAGLNSNAIFLPITCLSASDEPLFLLEKADQYFTFIPAVPGNEPYYWQGAKDLSAKVYLTRGENSLKLKVEVLDDVHVQPYHGSDILNGDSVIFGLRLPGYGKRRWKFGLAHHADGKPEIFYYERPLNTSIILETQRNEAKKLTIYKVEIPFKSILMTKDIAADGFRFNLIVNDNDGDRREGYLYITPGLGEKDDDFIWKVVNIK